MNLDLPTIMVMESFAVACSGAFALFCWFQNRDIAAIGLWGLANIAAAIGMFSVMLGFTLHQVIWLALGGIVLPMQSGLMWKAARVIDSKPASLFLALLGPAIIVFAGGVPGLGLGGAISLAGGAAYTVATAMTLWLSRKEHLAMRWPLIILMMIHASVLMLAAYSAATYSIRQILVPPVVSIIGGLYFENIIFALGTTVFVLLLVKERSEAAGRMAARIDPLTGIFNRGGFMDSAGRALERCRRDSAPISLVMFDLDRFKAVNDRHGHAIGDAVIRKFCEFAATRLRPNDIFGRMGGEEFAVALPGASVEVACARAERIRAAVAENCRFVAGRQVNASVSGGVSVSEKAELSLDALLEYADAALYRAKTEGRNRIERADQAESEGGPFNVLRLA